MIHSPNSKLRVRLAELEAEKAAAIATAAETKARADALEASLTAIPQPVGLHGLNSSDLQHLAFYVANSLPKNHINNFLITTRQTLGPDACRRIGAYIATSNPTYAGVVRIALETIDSRPPARVGASESTGDN